MGFSSIFYGSGNKPYTASYQGSTYTTQTYCEPPLFKAALTMPTEFGASIRIPPCLQVKPSDCGFTNCS
jgi:hypothetical protein